jgi:hypothetical protein
MDQSNSKWTRWVAIALCALALNAMKRPDDSVPRQALRTAAAAEQPASPHTTLTRSR